MKKRKIATVMVIILTIAGLSLMLYPTISNVLKTLAFRRAINQYNAAVEKMDDETYERILTAAREYNEKLAARGGLKLELSESELAEYESLLDITGNGIMGYVVIEKIKISLPVYHGTSDAVLQSGIGHLEGTSLPVGGESTHTVLSGHRGLPSAQLFTSIDRLTEGDTFTVHVLNETLIYEVDQILTVLPHELGALNIVEGEDYCTLLTCTPYGVNTHRLLVRGHRIGTSEDKPTGNDAVVFDIGADNSGIILLIIIIAVFGVLLLSMLIASTLRRHKNKTVSRQE